MPSSRPPFDPLVLIPLNPQYAINPHMSPSAHPHAGSHMNPQKLKPPPHAPVYPGLRAPRPPPLPEFRQVAQSLLESRSSLSEDVLQAAAAAAAAAPQNGPPLYLKRVRTRTHTPLRTCVHTCVCLRVRTYM